MLGARARQPIRNLETRRRLDEARRQSPESEPWLGLLEAALSESENAAVWEDAVPEPVADRPASAPLLFRTLVGVDGPRTRRWVRRLARLAQLEMEQSDPLALLEVAIRQQNAPTDAPALRVLAQMAAFPFLQACGRVLERRVPGAWWEGYCPVCGGWPILAELRGLDRKRWLRCGRCATAWEIPALRCPFCDETHHERLGYFAPEGDGQTRKVEVCHTCKGYVKALTTVRAVPSWAVLLDDLSTVPLDLVALERGYHRPERPGHDLAVRLTERSRTPRALARALSLWRKAP
ncbi:MAG TPA: formate dehydrogenase accessory protein FdhE [Gemmatimonadales bacterium]